MKDELAQVKHARSAKDYPDINLEADEHVVLHITRSRIGIIAIWTMAALCVIILSLALILIANNDAVSRDKGDGVALVDEFYCGLALVRAAAQF